MRYALAFILAGITLAAATFFGTAHLKLHGRYHCTPYPGHPHLCIPAYSYWVVGRYWWQIPLGVLIGIVGLAAAAAVARRH